MNEIKKKTRINRFDNLKGLAIFLVVLGHLAFLTKYDSINFIHSYVLIFHMAIFFFVSGYFSRTDEKLYIKSVKRILIPYIIFTIIFWLVYLPFGKASQLIFIYPSYALWFLLALFFMKMALPVINKFKYPLLISFLFALLYGFIDCGDILGLPRAFAFFPVFLIGFYYRNYKKQIKEKYEKLDNLINDRLFAILISIIVLISSILIAYYLPCSIIMMKKPYVHPYSLSIIFRLVIIILGILITLILNRFVTNKECFLTRWGRNSMAIYILHIFFIMFLKKFAKGILYQQGELIGLIFTFAASLLIVWILSQDIVTEYFNKFTDFFSNFILKDETV